MKKLIAKIREILRNRRVRRIWMRTVSSIAGLVVFVTTYALVLPAITMESEAACGMEAHQHDDSCYEEQLICDLPESEGHTHTEKCYETRQELICDLSEHLHTTDCYDEEGNLICGLEEHRHGADCYEEIRDLVCGLEESEGHHHDASCYEKVLICGKEVHTHSPACYRQDAASAAATERAAVAVTVPAELDENGAADDTGNAGTDGAADAFGTFDPAETAAEGYVPALDELDFRQLLNDSTTVYYHRPADDTATKTEADAAEGQTEKEPENSGQIADWQKVDEDTELGENDILRVYLAYTIPAGSLNETNPVARYRLPANLHLTDEQIDAINQTENGLSSLYVDYETLQITDPEKHSAYLGAEAVEGLRTPDQTIEEYSGSNRNNHNDRNADSNDGSVDQAAQEFISAVVKADQVYDKEGLYGEKDALLGTDLVFTFSPYTILKNRNEYDSKGKPVKAGESVSGWFTLDLNIDQVDWDGSDHNTAEITFVSDSKENKELGISPISVTLQKADPADPASEEKTDEDHTDVTEETHPAVSFEDSLTVHTGSLGSDITGGNGSDATGSGAPAGTLPASSKLTVSVSAEAGTFPAGTTMVLSAVPDMDAVAEAVEGTVDSKTCGFQAVDISFRDKDGKEIEPLKPISVTMRSDSIKAATEDSSMAPVVVHVEDRDRDKEKAETGDSLAATVIETLSDTTENKEQSEKPDAANSPDAISFESDAFSVYAIVYTVDFHWEVNGKTYDFSIPGGGFVSLEQLVELLGIARTDANAETGTVNDTKSDNNKEGESLTESNSTTESEKTSEHGDAISLNDVVVSKETKNFVADVTSVKFSSPELVWVGKVEKESIVGALKDANGLDVQYSAELTEEQIAKINNSTVEAGDWAMISLQAFTSEESLTVTMKNEEQFVVRVTDALHVDPRELIGKEIIIYDKTENFALTDDWEQNQYRTQLGSVEYGGDGIAPANAHWTVEGSDNNYYLKSYGGKYLKIDNTNISLVNTQHEATALTIQKGGNPDYRIYAKNDDSKILTYSENNNHPSFFSTPGGVGGTGTTRVWLGIEYAVKVPDPVGDWLIYLDEDLDEITLHVGETLTLRPYDEWTWKESAIQSAHWNVGGVSDWNISNNDANGAKKSTWNDGVFSWTRYVKHDDQLDTRYWSVQGRATATGDYILTNSKNNHTITVHVVDGAPVNKPGTITNTAGIKVNLFDYDKNYLLDPSDNTNLASNNNNKSDSINKEAGSSHFYFLSSGSGASQNDTWNNYTKDKNNPNIVKDKLDANGYPVLTNSNKSLQYLFDTSQASQVWHGGNNSDPDAMIAYPNVEGMFQRDSNGFYYYNSNANYFFYNTETGHSYLYEHTYTQTSSEAKGSLVNDKPIGFFPFHDYDSTSNLYVNQNSNLNHHVGLSMDIDFILPTGKRDANNQKFVFDFSGDDDLWVFLEWTDAQGKKHSKRMLDLGGIHQPITGSINFTDDNSIEANRPYRLKVFYLERGGCDSNCSIRFNLPVEKELSLEKKLTGLTDAERGKYKDEQFTYEVFVNNQLYNDNDTIRRDATGKIIERGFTITNGQVTIKDGETVTITGLARTDTFYAAEEKSLNMEQFEAPHAERYYQSDTDGTKHEEEIPLTESQTQGAAEQTKDWKTPTYSLQDTEKVTFTNTLKEKDLEVDKKWIGEGTHPDEVKFTVSASVEGDNGALQPYTVSVLKKDDGTTDKEFTLSKDNNWYTIIEHLPVQNPDGKVIVYDIKEAHVDGYVSSAKDLTDETYNYCNVDAVKLWPDNQHADEVITVKLKNSSDKFYAGTDAQGNAVFNETGQTFELTKGNNYTHRFARLPFNDTYTVVQGADQNDHTSGLVTYVRNIVQYQLTNTPTGQQVDPDGPKDNPEIHKRIDALRDRTANPDSAHTGEDLTDLYRLYLDYKVNSLQEASGVDLLFVIDHSGSMNNIVWQGNPNRAPAVMQALNGENGLISQFLDMNEKNQWAAVGFKGPDGALDYAWKYGNEWSPITNKSRYNAGENGSEILSPGGTAYEFSRVSSEGGSSKKYVDLADEGPDILTNYTAGLWRAEQFLLKDTVKKDGRKKVVVFISDGIPTLHIDCPNGTLAGAGSAVGSYYYRDRYGGCPAQTLTEFGYFVNDMTAGDYTFGDNLEFYTIGFGGIMQTASGEQLLTGMLDAAYGADKHDGHFMTINDTPYSFWGENDVSAAANKLKEDLRTIMGMNETFTNIVIQDDLSKYVDLFVSEGETNLLKSAKAKVTMTDPDNPAGTVVLWENGSASSSAKAKFTKANGQQVPIISGLVYDASTKTVKAVFDPEYKAAVGITYTLSFDVKATDEAYDTYASTGYDKYTTGDLQGQVITGDTDTDFPGTDPANTTSSGKPGFRSNDSATASYKHNGTDEHKDYPHPVIQAFNAEVHLLKTDQEGKPLTGAKFRLYKDAFNPADTDEARAANAANCIGNEMVSVLKGTGEDQVAEIAVKNLKPGVYYLVETEAPGGYMKSEPVKIEVKVNTTINNKISQDTVRVTASMNNKVLAGERLKGADGIWTLEVMNTAGYELPSTGGPGTTLIYLLGFLLTAIAGTGLKMKNRRKNAA